MTVATPRASRPRSPPSQTGQAAQAASRRSSTDAVEQITGAETRGNPPSEQGEQAGLIPEEAASEFRFSLKENGLAAIRSVSSSPGRAALVAAQRHPYFPEVESSSDIDARSISTKMLRPLCLEWAVLRDWAPRTFRNSSARWRWIATRWGEGQRRGGVLRFWLRLADIGRNVFAYNIYHL